MTQVRTINIKETTMEIVIGLVVLIAVVYLLGLFKPVVNVADVANREAQVWNNEHKVGAVNRMAKLELDTDKVKKATENLSVLDSFDI